MAVTPALSTLANLLGMDALDCVRKESSAPKPAFEFRTGSNRREQADAGKQDLDSFVFALTMASQGASHPLPLCAADAEAPADLELDDPPTHSDSTPITITSETGEAANSPMDALRVDLMSAVNATVQVPTEIAQPATEPADIDVAAPGNLMMPSEVAPAPVSLRRDTVVAAAHIPPLRTTPETTMVGRPMISDPGAPSLTLISAIGKGQIESRSLQGRNQPEANSKTYSARHIEVSNNGSGANLTALSGDFAPGTEAAEAAPPPAHTLSAIATTLRANAAPRNMAQAPFPSPGPTRPAAFATAPHISPSAIPQVTAAAVPTAPQPPEGPRAGMSAATHAAAMPVIEKLDGPSVPAVSMESAQGGIAPSLRRLVTEALKTQVVAPTPGRAASAPPVMIARSSPFVAGMTPPPPADSPAMPSPVSVPSPAMTPEEPLARIPGASTAPSIARPQAISMGASELASEVIPPQPAPEAKAALNLPASVETDSPQVRDALKYNPVLPNPETIRPDAGPAGAAPLDKTDSGLTRSTPAPARLSSSATNTGETVSLALPPTAFVPSARGIAERTMPAATPSAEGVRASDASPSPTPAITNIVASPAGTDRATEVAPPAPLHRQTQSSMPPSPELSALTREAVRLRPDRPAASRASQRPQPPQSGDPQATVAETVATAETMRATLGGTQAIATPEMAAGLRSTGRATALEVTTASGGAASGGTTSGVVTLAHAPSTAAPLPTAPLVPTITAAPVVPTVLAVAAPSAPKVDPLVGQIVSQAQRTLAVYPEQRSATFQIRPPELGRITIEVSTTADNQTRMTIQAHSPQGREALQANAAQLRYEFDRQGLPQPQLDLSLAGNGSHGSPYAAMDQRQARQFLSDSRAADNPRAARRMPTASGPSLGIRSKPSLVRTSGGGIRVTI